MSRTLLAGILLAALPASAQDAGTAPAWDEPLAAAIVHAFDERPLPGFEGAALTPKLACTGKSSWMISFFTPTPYRKIRCIVDEQVSSLGEGCVVDVGGLIVLGDPRTEGVEACPFENGHTGQGRLELRTPVESGNRLLAGSDKTWLEKDWSELTEKPRSVFQRDAKGRQCIAAPSPGLPNPPCP